MKFSGTNTLYLPKVSQMNYLIRDIILDSTDRYSVYTKQFIPFSSGGSGTGSLFQMNAGFLYDSSGRFVSTYNTGEPFSVSGWLDFSTQYRYFSMGNILTRCAETIPSTGVIGELTITCPTSGTMMCDMLLNSSRLTNWSTLGNVTINGSATGAIGGSVDMYVTGGAIQFYKSYESLITGGPLLAYIDTRFPNSLIYYDNDVSDNNNPLSLDYAYFTTYGAVLQAFNINRSGLYYSGLYQLIDFSTDSGFSGLFNGVWSGNQFIYQDVPSSITLNHYLNISDAQGNSYPLTGVSTVNVYSLGAQMPSEYITGFSLTASGQYLNPPLIAATGYYYSTGIQQSIASLLFSTGCTGNIVVTFSGGGGGSGASGALQLSQVLFSGVYVPGQSYYNVVSNYVTTNVGTGYTLPPKAFINTGMYGSACFDVPRSSGYSQAWFTPFDTSGTMTPEAAYFTGVALCVTGIVGGGATGFIVTGIDVYNIGSGYSNKRPPCFSFIRTGVDNLTQNASGILYTKISGYNSGAYWTAIYSVAGTTAQVTGMAGIIPLLDNNRTMSIQIFVSGMDLTVPVSGYVQTFISGYNGASIISPFLYNKYFNTDPFALKKKDNPVITFGINTNLSFLLTQSELDTLYSSAGYTNNTWPFSLGDFNF